MRLVLLLVAGAAAAAAAAVRFSRGGPRYAYGRWIEPDLGLPRVAATIDGS